MPTHRKKPFSGRQKKLQLKERKARKAAQQDHDDEEEEVQRSLHDVSKKFVPASTSKGTSELSHETLESKRLVSVFEKLPQEVIAKARLKSMKPFQRLPQTALEIGVDSFEPSIDFPKRPKWMYDMTKEQVESQEEESFQNWMKEVNERYGQSSDGTELSWFEHNLEVWRQLWRVLEISDIILVIMDIRHPLLHFPRALYNYVVKDLGRKIVGVDLVSEFTVFAWRKYFEEQFPELHIACFSCYPRDEKLIDDTKTYALKSRVKRPRKRYYHAQGVRDLLSACRDVRLEKQGTQVDWEGLIQRYEDNDDQELAHSETSEDEESDTESTAGLDDEFSRVMEIHNRDVTPHKDYITLGLVGHPNVGKSSLVNSIMGKTVVSASRTPGHTKHFQTIHLTENVRLCDSPGLVFPTLLPRALQILSGMYPVAQVQEPYSVVQYLAERIPLEKVLSLTPPDLQDSKSYQWSAWSICEAFADQRGFYTAKAARPDVYRGGKNLATSYFPSLMYNLYVAANTILRLTNDGRILLSFKPPGFFQTSKYEKLRVAEVDASEKEMQQAGKEEGKDEVSDNDDSDRSEEQEEEENLHIQTGGSFALLAESE
ncbi:Guanine nucleotide-binding-like protein 1 [Apophysomyces ossiformis]|uniref:Guanine nucleotide-binding protein-like 1 n=1 Tax=Apophysomyces ossiformis TaxID=679940 RepID=A0A8H7EM81_9FUNG|nr:Guanine nucleotide-binding-like protein 1 [Apophysomyces ossiformis]